MSKFQLIIIAIFTFFIIVGVGVFATFRGGDNDTKLAPITVWGTFPADVFNKYTTDIYNNTGIRLTVNYSEKSPAVFSKEFISALARGQGPDAILLSADELLPHYDKIILLPFEAMTEREFKDAYIQEGEIYISDNGIAALPFVIDPLIMYWNRDNFSVAGLASHPKFWDEIPALISKLTNKDSNGNIRKQTVAMGVFSNIVNAREILGSLILQLGNPITKKGEINTQSTLKNQPDISSAISFFSQFVNPNNQNYTWNRGLQDSKLSFLIGNLSIYFGFASEIVDMREKNPNLNFDIASLPQIRNSNIKATYGRLYGLSIVRSASDPTNVYDVLSILVSPQNMPYLQNSIYLPSVRRDIILAGTKDPYMSIFNQAALVSKIWFDADPQESRRIFSNMIDSVTSGAKSVSEAVYDANDEYDVVLQNILK